MRMSAADIQAFPKLAQYVRFAIPRVVDVPVIVRNARRFGSMTADQFRHAVRWNNLPNIVITPLFGAQCGGVAAANGCFRPANGDIIELAQERAQEFETDAFGSGTDQNARHQNVFIVGTTLLHELCHWGNFQHGVAEATEQGVAFEVATYGRNTG